MIIDTQYCTLQSVLGREVKLKARLNDHQTHADRIPLVLSTVSVTQ